MTTLPVTRIQRFSTHDGDGIRTVVFTKGCPLRCVWCHNPETIEADNQILYMPGKCIGCRLCEGVCGRRAHVFTHDEHSIARERCTACMACADVCPTDALQKAAVNMTLDEIMAEIGKDAAFYGVKGGVTLSGGEPMMHGEECIALLNRVKAAGFTTAIETSGYFSDRHIEPLSKAADTVLWDFKDGDDARHMRNTGVSNAHILRNLVALDGYETRIILRCIMVKGVNMDETNAHAIAHTALRLAHCAGVKLLPYHPMGGSKNEQLGLGDNGRREWIPAEEEIAAFKARLKDCGVDCT